jgi:hypothetical protein
MTTPLDAEALAVLAWARLSRKRLDELILAARKQWGPGSEQHNLVRDIADALFRDFPADLAVRAILSEQGL